MTMKTNQKLQLAKEWYNDPSTTKEEKSHLEKIFPELKESEDEKIRKCVKRLINGLTEEHFVRCGASLNEIHTWLEKHAEPVTVVERDGEQWVRVCAFGEDFIIAARDYQEGDKTEFTWEEACKIGTFSKKQGYIMLALLNEINARLEEIGGEPLASFYWSSSECSQSYAWGVDFSSGDVNYYGKYSSNVARAVAAF